MKKEIDCQVFADQLDALLQGTLPDEGLEQLQLHAGSCPECAMQLRVHEHLALPSLAELEAAVPADLLATVWPRVEKGGAEQPKSRGEGRVSSRGEGRLARRATFLVPAMAAATIALLFSTGLLLSELRQATARETRLAQQIIELEERMAAVGEQSAVVKRTGNLRGRNSWTLALSRQDRISVAELRDQLRNLPSSTTLLDTAQVDALLRNTPSWTPAAWREALVEFQGEEGISVQEFLGLLDSSMLNPERTMPTARLIELLS